MSTNNNWLDVGILATYLYYRTQIITETKISTADTPAEPAPPLPHKEGRAPPHPPPGAAKKQLLRNWSLRMHAAMTWITREKQTRQCVPCWFLLRLIIRSEIVLAGRTSGIRPKGGDTPVLVSSSMKYSSHMWRSHRKYVAQGDVHLAVVRGAAHSATSAPPASTNNYFEVLSKIRTIDGDKLHEKYLKCTEAVRGSEHPFFPATCLPSLLEIIKRSHYPTSSSGVGGGSILSSFMRSLNSPVPKGIGIPMMMHCRPGGVTKRVRVRGRR